MMASIEQITAFLSADNHEDKDQDQRNQKKKIRPTTKEEAMLWQTVSKWDWFPIHTWPPHIQSKWLQRHLFFQDRYIVLLFLIGNGMEPQKAYNAIVRRPNDTYDNAAQKQMQHILQMVRTHDASVRKYRYYDMCEREFCCFK